ncbi:uncharacterized protein LOC127712429 [Mytilus californianus]|uniref:uncharacterized protein LOC127712429 n=1 Tax=Mytilus californianus TaxID=6549 RepID=UPI002245022F|nr:uncharacterized protein LOC127712429 [Mytilus californianus]
MVIQREEPTQTLAKRRVLYIGSSVPLETTEGLEAVQQPLRDRYPVGEHAQLQGIDSTLTVLYTGLQIQYIDDPDTIVFFPISSLTVCAAVRPVNAINAPTGEVMAKFVSLNSEIAAQNAKNPAIFTAITRRAKGRKVLECHGFVCASDQDALDIVKATSMADQMKRENGTIQNGQVPYRAVNGSGIRPGSFRVVNGTVPVETTAMVNGSLRRIIVDKPVSARQNVRLSAGDNIPSVVDDVPQEFYDSPPPQGYFYRPNNVQAKSFKIEKKEPPISARSRVSNSFVQPADIPPPPSPPSPPVEPAPVPPPPPPPQQPPIIEAQPPPQDRPTEALSARSQPERPLHQENGIPPPPLGRPRGYMPRNFGAPFYPPPPSYMKPMYYPPPPPPMTRPRFFSPQPSMRAPPYPYPYQYPMYPQFVKRRRPKRKESESPHSKSSDSRHSSHKSPRDHEETERKRIPNGDFDSESDDLFRPRTPPRDYEYVNADVDSPRKERMSRREEYEKRRNRKNRDKIERSPPRMMYSGYRPYYMYQPQSFNPYMPPEMARYPPRSSSVPPHLRYTSKDRKANKKQKKNKKKEKSHFRGGGPHYPYGKEDISMESGSVMGGYASEIPQGAYPTDGYYFYPHKPPRDFRREKNQFLNEKSFSRRMQEEHRTSRGKKQEYYPTAYELNDAQAEERLNEPDFTMY